MALVRWTLMNREGKGRDVSARVTLCDRSGMPIPHPGNLNHPSQELKAPDAAGNNPASTDPATFAWNGVRVQVEVQGGRLPPFPGSTRWSQVLSCPQPLYSPMVTTPPEIYEVRVYVDSAGPRGDLVLVTVLMMDGTAGWNLLCDSVCVALL
jgi:hypothetical protein